MQMATFLSDLRIPALAGVLTTLPFAVLIALAFIWIQAVVDQIPCFLGVPFRDRARLFLQRPLPLWLVTNDN
jgi:hypothetical protein